MNRFRPGSRRNQVNPRNERGNAAGVRRSADRRPNPNTSPSYNGTPAQHHGRPRSGNRPSTSPNRGRYENGDDSRFGGAERQQSTRISRDEPRGQYRVSGERYVQDTNAQDGVRIPIKSY